jgi:neutral ceramidase
MGGYGARKGPATGVHDDLYVRSIVFEADDGERFGLITCDLLNFDRPVVERVRELVSAATGMAPERIMLAASHTHSGPSTRILMFGEPPAEYKAWLPVQLASSLIQACADLGEAEVAGAVGEVAGLGANRTDPALPHDPSVRLLAASAGGRLKAVLLNYGCHPTVMGPENLLVSADWPGAAVAMLGRALGYPVWIGFAQGAAGDVSARFVRRAQSFAEVERLGSLLAGKSLEMLGNLPAFGVASCGGGLRSAAAVGVRSRVVSLEPRALPGQAEAEAAIATAEARLAAVQAAGASPGEIRIAETALQGARIALAWKSMQDKLEFDAEVQVARIGRDVALVGLSCEPFSALGLEIRRRSPFATTLVVGYANGYCGYMPDEASFARGGYEASSAFTAPGSGERLAETALTLLGELKAEVA